MKSKDQPLRYEVKNDKLIISIGIDILAFVSCERTEVKVSNPLGFAKDVKNELEREDEIGATIITDVLDTAIKNAIDNGSMYSSYEETDE